MTKPLPTTVFADARPLRTNLAPRTFNLHPALHLTTLGGYLTYLAIMAAAFMNPELVIPFAIFVIVVVAGFLVPGLWARVVPAATGRHQSLAEFVEEGVDTWTGPLSGKGAIAQVTIMPAVLVAWGLIVALIRATA
jgi:hypothetical protein